MSTQIGEVNINLRMSLAKFQQDVRDGQRAASDGTKKMADDVRANTQDARGALMLFSEEIGVNIPRHLQTAIARLPGLGSALNAAFSSIAVVAFLEVLVKIVEKITATQDAITSAEAAANKFD